MRRLIAHLIGDYIIQSDYLAQAKTHRTGYGVKAATAHALLYTACFLPLTRNPLRLAIIGVTHGLLDHYRPLPKLIHAKDKALSPRGWPATRPSELPFWLHIVVDNTTHLLVNEVALDWGHR